MTVTNRVFIDDVCVFVFVFVVLINAMSNIRNRQPKGVSSNRTTLFNNSFFTSFWRSAVCPNRSSSYTIYFGFLGSPVCGCFRDILISL
jgi:hypothetical protein